jgi:amphi-Trp domain-containing protein
MALAAALREGGDAELELGPVTLSLRVPDDLRSEIEVEVGDGEIELEIEFKWPTASTTTAPARTVAGTEKATRRKNVPAKPGRSSTGTTRSRSAKRAATKTS